MSAESYYDALRKAGISHEEATAAVEEQDRIRRCLDECICPSCGEPMQKKIDDRQAGMSEVPGTWVNYRCEKGGFQHAVDRKEVFE